MSRVKDIRLKVIPSKIANDFVKANHYSGKVVQNSKLHFGAFLDNVLHGVMSFGSSTLKERTARVVRGTGFNEFIELNRMAFDEVLPKYSESRCISIAMKLIKKQAPHIKWVVSFADGCQSGDGTIYRAVGFVLVSVKKNTTMILLPNGEVTHKMNFALRCSPSFAKKWNPKNKRTKSIMEEIGAKPLKGFQLKYIYFLYPEEQKNLTVPILPFSKIKEMGASMYLGKKCDVGVKRSTTSIQDVGGGAIPTTSLHLSHA